MRSFEKSINKTVYGQRNGLSPEDHYGMLLKRTFMIIRTEQALLSRRKSKMSLKGILSQS